MGVSGKWLKSIITQKKTEITDEVTPKTHCFLLSFFLFSMFSFIYFLVCLTCFCVQDKSMEKTKKKWRLWRSSSEGFGSSSKRGHLAASEASDSDDAFSAAMAAVVRAPSKNFKVVRQEFAAIRIQTTFRGLLARRALRALKAVVRIQAIFRGRQVRKQAAVTLRCMQALVRVQARVRARSVGISPEEQAAQKLLDEYHNQADPTKQAEQGWCDIPGTADEVRAKLQLRQEGAIKRERAIAYFCSQQQQSRSCPSPNSRVKKPATSLKHHRLGKSSPGWSWLDNWMLEEIHTDPSEMMTPFSRKSEDNIAGMYSYSEQLDSVKVRRNNVTTRVLAKPPTTVGQITRSSSSPSSESPYDETSPSTSSSSASLTPMSGNILMMERAEESYYRKPPSYMNLTESTKAKQKASRFSHKNLMSLSNGDNRSCADSDPSFNLCKDLYPPIPLYQHDWSKARRH
ncbi:hypothetical protein Ddye_013060 [Dipteronia dyeriana]|uniref:Uncharacterized protein n=1 Tax=Dipteronia dyeriana TaxID=168575 RepID=A0AAD9X5K5_9ROSI|nr:hypothetical protein Ddye_013060 [Dipteronia dyeriana]